MLQLFLLILGLLLTLCGANYLTDGAAALAHRLRIPEFIVGLTVVAIGTSAPELVVSVLSSLSGNGDMAVGNVVGSNLFNGFVIVGICALIAPIALTRENIRRDIPFGFAASLILVAVLSDDLFRPGAEVRIGRAEGLVMAALYVLLIGYSIRAARRAGAALSLIHI